jgi:leader peptidase (prepilin peptidase) / N-methyltransferase
MLLTAVFSLAPGLALGSFLNVVAARLPKRQSLVRPRSACRSCGMQIGWRDNVPVLSYALLRGRCRSCRTPIGLVYPAVELATAVLIAGCVLAFGASLRALVGAVFCAALVVVTATDLEHRIIPNKVVGPASLLVLVGQTIDRPSPEWAIAAFGASAFLLVAALAYPGGMGMGDVKLAFLMGAALGRSVTVALMLGMVTALLPSIVLLARHGAKARKMGIPFGPFLALGSVIALFAGQAIFHAYLGLY